MSEDNKKDENKKDSKDIKNSDNIKNKSKGNGGNGEEKQNLDEILDEETRKKKEEELINQLQEEIDKLTTKDIVIQMMMSLSSLAYKKMGIPEGVNDKFKDKSQAKMAIDCFEALLKVISDEVSAQELENLKSSLSNLQYNFVKKFL